MEFWAIAAVSVGTAAVGAYASSRSSRGNTKDQIAADKEMARIQGDEDRRSTLFESDLNDYNVQLAKQRKRDARTGTLDKFSQIQKPADFERPPLLVAKPTLPPVIVDPKPGKK